jgi:predicted kinase
MISDTCSDQRPVAVLLCGVAGAGKTTYAQVLEREGFARLSIDEELWRRFGRYGVDYAPERYAELSSQAESWVREQLAALLQQGKDVVVDSSLWRRSRRDEYKALVTLAGGRWRLIHLVQRPEVLRARLRKRAQRFDANAAFAITDEMLDDYLAGFEPPRGEGEEVVAESTT